MCIYHSMQCTRMHIHILYTHTTHNKHAYKLHTHTHTHTYTHTHTHVHTEQYMQAHIFLKLTTGAWSEGWSSSSTLPERRLSSESDPLSEWTDCVETWEPFSIGSFNVLLLGFTVALNVLRPPWASDTMLTIVWRRGGGRREILIATVAMAAHVWAVVHECV